MAKQIRGKPKQSSGKAKQVNKNAQEDILVPTSEKTLDYFFDDDTWSKIEKDLGHFTEKDMKSLRFQSLEGCIQFYSLYAKIKGFGVRRRTPRYSSVDGEPCSCPLLCAAAGVRDETWLNLENRQREPKPITRFDCKAEIRVQRDRKTTYWRIYYFVDEHSHDMVEPRHVQYIRSHRKIEHADRIFIAQMYNSGINQSNIRRNMVQQAGGYKNVCSTKKDLYNAVDRIRKEEIKDGDAETVMAYLDGKSDSDPSLYISHTRDEEKRLEKLFWCDGKSRNDYQKFGHVMGIDTTYKCNAYNKPFIVLIGVNHHRKTVVFGCALLVDEKECAFTWVLEQLVAAGNGQKLYTVLTDGDKALANAIKVVFPEARHRLCLWHLMRNVKGNGGPDFAKGFMKCVDKYKTTDDFEKAWKKLVVQHGVQGKKWVNDLYEDRHKWEEAYLRGHFFAGMRSTQRCESMHSSLKKVLDQKVMLYRFIRLCDLSFGEMRFKEGNDDYTSKHTEPVITGALQSVKTHASSLYTRNAFRLLCKEMEKEAMFVVRNEVVRENEIEGPIFYMLDEVDEEEKQYLVIRHDKYNIMYCCCLKLESVGFPCKHMFAVMKFAKMKEIPKLCIKKRWTIQAKDELDFDEGTNKGEEDDHTRFTARFARLNSFSMKINRETARRDKVYDKVIDFYLKILDLLGTVEEEETGLKSACMKKSPIGIGDPKVVTSVKGRMKKRKRTCGKCHRSGHNQRTCPGEGANIPQATQPQKTHDDFDDPSSESICESKATYEETSTADSMDSMESLLKSLSLIGDCMPNTYADGDMTEVAHEYDIADLEANPLKYDWDPQRDHW